MRLCGVQFGRAAMSLRAVQAAWTSPSASRSTWTQAADGEMTQLAPERRCDCEDATDAMKLSRAR